MRIKDLTELGQRISELKNNLKTEEATKHSCVLPFIQLLGYNIFNPNEVVPEYTSDFGTKNGEKVDYAIIRDSKPVLIIEVKSINVILTENHAGQLFRYYNTSSASYAVLTNGMDYKFFCDSEEINKMDRTPFYTFNILSITDKDVSFLNSITKENFSYNRQTVMNFRYAERIKDLVNRQFVKPDLDFISFVCQQCNIDFTTEPRDIAPIISEALIGAAEKYVKHKAKPTKTHTVTSDIQETDSSSLREVIDTALVYSFNSPINPNGYSIDFIKMFGVLTQKVSFMGAILLLMNTLYAKDTSLVEALVDDVYFEGKVDWITRDPNKLPDGKKLDNVDIYVKQNLTPARAMKFMSDIVIRSGLDMSEFEIKYI